MASLERLVVQPLTGSEPFRLDNQDSAFNVLDFWRWSISDLVMNTTRGFLAEYIVARALGIPTDGVRESWRAYDLETTTGLRIEVKSSAYLQSWSQEAMSTIQFVVPKRRGWDATTNQMESVARRHADVYVFALLTHTDKASLNPLDLNQWRFWAVNTPTLDARTRSQHSITLASLRKLAGEPTGFGDLALAVEKVAGKPIRSPG
jgi:hypothetical protein